MVLALNQLYSLLREKPPTHTGGFFCACFSGLDPFEILSYINTSIVWPEKPDDP
ncbi:Uncharacterised protein [Photobacterium damselae]|nr:Uncharacterised protein [Photobacterium damselae]SUB91758.1 Uncharacterised protein [Photobacterium damselae]